MRKIPSALLPLLFSLLILLGFYIGTYSSRGTSYSSNRIQKLDYLLQRVDELHLNPTGVDSLLEQAISELLHQLDPHSAYLNAEEVQRSRESVSGSFVGIGVEFNVLDDTVWVRSIIEGGPASKAGLRGGDALIASNGETLGTLENNEIIKRLKGQMGTEVPVDVYRPASSTIMPFTIIRGEVPIPSVDVSFHPNENTLFLRISRFSEPTFKEVQNALKKHKAENLSGIILDLRDNPGGLLQQAVDVASLFLAKDDSIVYVEDNRGKATWYINKKQGAYQRQSLVVLINEGSASASEILAGAIQDNDRGVIIGRRSFGKGLVQEEISLPDGSKVRLTTSRYFTPSGRVIQKPYDKGFEAYKNEIFDRIHGDDQQTIETPVYRTRNGRILYGGGGVRPDIQQDRDSLSFAAHAFHLLGTIEALKSIQHFAAIHFDSIANYSPEMVWSSNDKDLVLRLFPQAEYIPEEDVAQMGKYIKQQILSTVFGRRMMLPFVLRDDPFLQKSLRIMEHQESFDKLLSGNSIVNQ